MTELDPYPWVTPTRQYRLSKRQVEFYAPDCVIFDPREGYEQDRAKYPCNALCAILTA